MSQLSSSPWCSIGPIPITRHAHASDMDPRAQIGGDPGSVVPGLVDFCLQSVSGCLSGDADGPCVCVGLSSACALCMLLSFLLLVSERCRGRREGPEEVMWIPYSLLGHLCGAVGAALAGLLHIQVLLSTIAAALDGLYFISWCLHVFLCWNSKSERRRRAMRGRRRQHLLAACALTAATGALRAGLPQPMERPLSGRRLMHATLQDNTEILGYSLGLLSFVIACTSRFPAILRTHRGQILSHPQVLSRLLSSLAAALYAAAVLVYDTRLAFLLRTMPWSLSAACCCALDLVILINHWLKRQNRLQHTSSFLDSEESSDSDFSSRKKVPRRERSTWSSQTNAKNVQKVIELGPYMDVSIQPAIKISPPEVMAGMEEAGQSLNRKAPASGVGGFCSSDTSFDSSVSSDLEWDFEEENAQWIKTAAKQFLQQGRSAPPRLCSYAMSALRPPSVREECETLSSAESPKQETAAYSQ